MARTVLVTGDGTDPAQIDALRAELPESVDMAVHCAGGNTDFDNIGSIAADKGAGQSRGCILEHRPRRRARPQGHHRERRVPRLHRRHRILPRPARR